jgi:ferric-dicitrate binding protein FerR (iron transport regulator)
MTIENTYNALLAKVISNNATEEEKAKLEQMALESEIVSEEIKKAQRIWEYPAETIQQIPLENDKHKVQEQLWPKQNTISLTQWLTRIAAVLFIPLLIGSLWMYSAKINSNQTPELFVVESTGKQMAKCILADGTEVWLNNNSTLHYYSDFKKNNRTVELDGEAYFKVTKNREMPFVVKTSKANIRVLGTSFNLKAYSNEQIVQTTLDEGKVEFEALGKKGKQKLVMKPGEQVSFNLEKNSININEVDTYMYSAWRYGKYIFKDESLENIAKRLEEIYEVNIRIENDSLEALRLRGMIEHDHTVFDALENLEKTAQVKYTINGRTIELIGK